RYTFDLTTHNAAATESSAFHAIGMLTEWDELQYLAATLPREKTRRLVEVGVLLGNHSAFFLQALQPESLTLIDADPANIPFIERTAFYHLPEPKPAVDIQCAFVAGTASEGMFAGVKVQKKRLADLVHGGADFLKIDVDGGERDLLNGAETVIQSSRPIVMI